MKLRNPWLIAWLGLVVAWLVRLWFGTVPYHFRSIKEGVAPHDPQLSTRYIYAFWHENLLVIAGRHRRRDIRVLISRHADGELIAEACRHLGFSLVRGSTTRHAVEALRQMLRGGDSAHLAITPDGPRGPRRRVQPGIVYLASRTGMPIVPAGIAYDRPWRMRSWDRFALPRPFSRAVCVLDEPIVVPPDCDGEQLEVWPQRAQQARAAST